MTANANTIAIAIITFFVDFFAFGKLTPVISTFCGATSEDEEGTGQPQFGQVLLPSDISAPHSSHKADGLSAFTRSNSFKSFPQPGHLSALSLISFPHSGQL